MSGPETPSEPATSAARERQLAALEHRVAERLARAIDETTPDPAARRTRRMRATIAFAVTAWLIGQVVAVVLAVRSPFPRGWGRLDEAGDWGLSAFASTHPGVVCAVVWLVARKVPGMSRGWLAAVGIPAAIYFALFAVVVVLVTVAGM